MSTALSNSEETAEEVGTKLRHTSDVDAVTVLPPADSPTDSWAVQVDLSPGIDGLRGAALQEVEAHDLSVHEVSGQDGHRHATLLVRTDP